VELKKTVTDRTLKNPRAKQSQIVWAVDVMAMIDSTHEHYYFPFFSNTMGSKVFKVYLIREILSSTQRLR